MSVPSARTTKLFLRGAFHSSRAGLLSSPFSPPTHAHGPLTARGTISVGLPPRLRGKRPTPSLLWRGASVLGAAGSRRQNSKARSAAGRSKNQKQKPRADCFQPWPRADEMTFNSAPSAGRVSPRPNLVGVHRAPTGRMSVFRVCVLYLLSRVFLALLVFCRLLKRGSAERTTTNGRDRGVACRGGRGRKI